jgi:cell wall-associated NlpC family hydrolase
VLARSLIPAIALVGGTAALAAAGASLTLANWDAAQQRQVVLAGLMQDTHGSFDGAGHLSAAQADASMVALAARLNAAAAEPGGGPAAATGESGATGETGATGEAGAAEQAPAGSQGQTGETGSTGASGMSGDAGSAAKPLVRPVHTSQNPLTVVTFDRVLVDQLGLGDVAAHVQTVARAAGLRPPVYFGSEVVARFLELRYDHPAGTDRLELFPTDPITRAEAAWSLSRVLHFGSWNASYAREALSAFELPPMSAERRQALRIAVSRIGYPYVWGGTTDNTADGLEHGGFDCSGFAWRVFKLSGLPRGQQIQGRTAAEQAGEIPRSQRLRIAQLAPGDLLFFGSAQFKSRATERDIVHEGIYLGDNWVIHSSAQGVYVLPLKGSWLGSSFAWARRVIR